MERLIKLLVIAGVTGGFAAWSGWTSGFHLQWGALLLAVLAVVVVVRICRATPEESAEEEVTLPPDVVRSVGIGLLLGLVTAGLFGGWFWSLQQTPMVYAGYYDHDRTAFEDRLDALEQAGNHAEAARLIEQRLREPLSVEWHEQLAVRLYRDLVAAGESSEGVERVEFFRQAMRVAQANHLDDKAAASLCDQAEQDLEFVRKIDALREQGDWPQLADRLRAEMLQERHGAGLPQMLHDVLLDWGASVGSLEEKRDLYREAAGLARQHTLESELATALLTLTESVLTEREQRQDRDAATERLLESYSRSIAVIEDLQDKHRVYLAAIDICGVLGLDQRPLQEQLAAIDARVKAQNALIQCAQELREQESYLELVELLQQAIVEESYASDMPLQQLLHDALVEWCTADDALEIRQTRYQQALQTCRECGLSVGLFAEGLSAIDSRLAERDRTRRKVELLRGEKQHQELAAYLRFKVAERPEAEWLDPLAQWLFDALLAQAESEPQLPDKVRLYETALEIGNDYALQKESAQTFLADARKRLAEQQRLEAERNRPVELPSGACIGIARIWTEPLPNLLLADLWVENADGDHQTGLQAKDFKVTLNGIDCRLIVSSAQRQAVPLHIAFVVDVSKSVEGEALAAIKEGGNAFLRQLQGVNVQVKIIPFDSQVDRTHRWTSDLQSAAKSLDSLRANGKTALFQAVAAAAEELQFKPGDRRIVVITDGQDTEAGPAIDDVIAHCKSKNVVVYSLGLRTEQLDSETLQRLAENTGGQYVEASNTADIVETYLVTSRQLQRPLYRLLVAPNHRLPETATPLNFEVKVGGERSLTVTKQLSFDTPGFDRDAS